MKEKLKSFLKKKGWYNYIRFSYPFFLYQQIFKPRTIRTQKKETQFYKSFLNPCNLVFDIGAYDGHKTVAFLDISQRVVCCEPDPSNYALLQTRFRNKKKRVFIENKALSDHAGTAAFYLHHEGSAFNTLNPKWKELLEQDHLQKWNEPIRFAGPVVNVEVTTLDHLIKKYGVPDFVKIDVEGYEQWVLNGLTQKVPCLTFETMLPDFKNELFHCINRLEEISNNNLYNAAINEELVFAQFISRQLFVEWINQATVNHLEIAVKMNDQA